MKSIFHHFLKGESLTLHLRIQFWNLCDYSDAGLLVKGMIKIKREADTVAATLVDKRNRQVIFKIFTPLTDCISEIKFKYNLIEYRSFHVNSPEYSKTSHWSSWILLKFFQVNVSLKKWKSSKLYHFITCGSEIMTTWSYGPFSMGTEPLKFLAFWNCFYSAIFNRKQLQFGLAIHFHTIISKNNVFSQTFYKTSLWWSAKIAKITALMFFFHFQRAISWQEKI